MKVLLLVVALTFIIGVLLYFLFRSPSSSADKSDTDSLCVLTIGQRFASHDDYLRLFGITQADIPWGVVHPHYPHIKIWRPQYHNTTWHNEGDSAQMMPTITEWWQPTEGPEFPADSVVIKTHNDMHYFEYERLGEVRITFMRDLIDTSFVFLGVYRMDKQRSDTTRIVWERILDHCDLNSLEYIESLHN